MSNPTSLEALVPDSTSEAGPVTFEQQVNNVVKQLSQGEDGNWSLPEDIQASEEVRYAAMLEKRRRDTESALGKTRQQLKAEETMRKTLEQRVAAQVQIDLTPEEAETLDYLKDTDIDAWRKKMNDLEQKATTRVREELATLSSEASQQAEKARRVQVLEEFNRAAQVPITDEVLENDIPPRIVKRLEDGLVTFEEFLTEAEAFLTKPRVVSKQQLEPTPNLGRAGGGSDASAAARAMQAADDYSNTIF